MSKKHSEEELLVEYIKHHELATNTPGMVMCISSLSCADCKVLDMCNQTTIDGAFPLLTIEGLELIKHQYPEYYI